MFHEELPEGYVARKRLRSTRKGLVYLAEREADGQSVILKTFTPDNAGFARARRELQALQALDHPQILRPLEMIQDTGAPTLVLQHIPGITLREWVETEVPTIRSTLRVAAQLAGILSHVHERRYVHRDVTPRNIIVEPSSLETVLIDLGLARPLGSSAMLDESVSTGSGRGGTLEFLAPEQTGRMNRGWDFRSDLYTFGATLYFMLTGRPPFKSGDPLELIHAHIARVPEDPRELRPSIPAPLVRVVLRLLQKEPEERYANASLLHGDLSSLHSELDASGSIHEDSPLAGLKVSSDRLAFAKQLYGRERELERLEALLESAASGAPHAMLISGAPGMGKSALAEALRIRVGAGGGVLVSGKPDAYGRRPYSAWVSVLESLTHQQLMLDDARLDALREGLRSSLGSIAQALVDLVPDLAFILGEIPPIPRLGPRETQERLALALTRALRVLATREHPLVIVLDDLHAADASTLFLAESVLCADPAPEALLLLGTYRDDEVGSEHPLRAWMDRLAERGLPLESMELQALDSAATAALLGDALACGPATAQPLVEQIERKTGCNPFLIREFLENLHARGLLRFNGTAWEWNAEEIQAAEVPEGAVGLMLARIERLEPETAAVLRFAACAGDAFDLDFLVELGCGERAVLEPALFALAQAGLLVPARAGFRFAHARIRETAQGLLRPAEREQLHYEIGQFLLERTPVEALAERAFLLCEHLNQARSRVAEDLRVPLMRINARAGQRALSAGAADQAASYLAISRELLRDEDWSSERALALEVRMCGSDAEFQCGHYGRSLELLDELEPRDLSVLERVQVQAKRIEIFALTRSPEEAVQYAVKAFRQVGVRWRVPVGWLRLRYELWRGRRALERCRYGLDWKPPLEVDVKWLAPLVLSAATGGISARVDGRFAAIIGYRAARLYTKHGHLANPGFTLTGCALWELGVGGDPVRAASIVESARAWAGRNTDPVYDLRQEFIDRALIQPWLARRRKVLPPLTRIAERARELGDPEFAYYAGINHHVYQALGGETVSTMDKRLQDLADDVRRTGQRYPEAVPCHKIHALLLLEGEDLDARIEARVEEIEPDADEMPASGAVYYRTLCMHVLCVFGHHALAFEQSQKMRPDLFRVVPFLHVADHSFYRGLAAAALARTASQGARRAALRALCESERRFQRWSGWGPDFAHMAALLAAERAALRRETRSATTLYDQAARGAQQQGFVHHAALAYEHKAALLSERGRATEALLARREARALYARWGCPGKAARLQD